MYDLARSKYKKTDGVLPISVSFCFSGLFQKIHVQSEISPAFSSSSWVSITSPLVLPELPGDFLSALVRWCTGRVAALAEGLREWPCAAAGWAGFGTESAERGVPKKILKKRFFVVQCTVWIDFDCWIAWLPACLIDGLIAWLIACFIAWLIAELLAWLIDWLMAWLLAWLLDWLLDCLIDWLLDWLLNCLLDWLTAWLIDGLLDCLMVAAAADYDVVDDDVFLLMSITIANTVVYLIFPRDLAGSSGGRWAASAI